MCVFLVHHSYFIWQFHCFVTVILLQLLSSESWFLDTTQLLSQQYNCCTSRKCIWWHIPVHAIFAFFYLFFLPALSKPSRTPNKHHKTEQLFYFLFIQVLLPGDIHDLRSDCFSARYSQVLTKSASCKKWHGFPWFKHHSIACLALQWDWDKVFYQVVPELHSIKNRKSFSTIMWYSLYLLKFYQVSDNLYKNEL